MFLSFKTSAPQIITSKSSHWFFTWSYPPKSKQFYRSPTPQADGRTFYAARSLAAPLFLKPPQLYPAKTFFFSYQSLNFLNHFKQLVIKYFPMTIFSFCDQHRSGVGIIKQHPWIKNRLIQIKKIMNTPAKTPRTSCDGIWCPPSVTLPLIRAIANSGRGIHKKKRCRE